MVKISVIVPTYKPHSYIEICLQSLFDQSLDQINFEVILVLNGDKEPYFSYLRSLLGGREGYKLIYNERKGVSSARNMGIQEAVGDYIVFLDDDDFISSNFLEEMLKSKIASLDGKGIIQSNCVALKLGVGEIDDYIGVAYKKLKNTKFKLFKFRKFLSNVNGKLYSKELIQKYKFNTELVISEDAVFLFEVSKDISNIELVNDDSVKYFRCLREGSTIRKKRTYRQIYQNFILKIKAFSKVYFNDITEYSSVLFISRIIAVCKVLVVEIRDNSRYE